MSADCTCGGIDAVPHATDHDPLCSVHGIEGWRDARSATRGRRVPLHDGDQTCSFCGRPWGEHDPSLPGDPDGPTVICPVDERSVARRRLGEGDPQRYEISVVVGPCALADAEAVTDRMLAAAAPFGLGAVAVTSVYVEEDE